jgi:hypothetical protein
VLDTAITLSKDRDVRARFEDIKNRLDVLQMPDFRNVGKYLPDLFGFTLTGSITPKLVNGHLELDSHMGLPGGFTADVTLIADNRGLHVDEIKAHSDEAPLGLLDIRDLDFDYKPVEDSWEGNATVVLSKAVGIKGDGRLQARHVRKAGGLARGQWPRRSARAAVDLPERARDRGDVQ